MRQIFSGILAVALVGAGYYVYAEKFAACRIPVIYTIGDVDERFGITKDEIKAALKDAEELWEDTTGKELFEYSETEGIPVHFVYDDRQQVAEEEEDLRGELDEKEEVNDTIREEYEKLLASYDELKRNYETRAAAYEKRLAEYNAEVDRWNDSGGAPQDVYDRLSKEEKDLATQSAELNTYAKNLNSLTRKINQLSEQGNKAISEYNKGVARYNNRFNHDREFTQGDFQGDSIHIYQYDDALELRLVLAHEFGHALSIGHVEVDPESVMYYLMEGQLSSLKLSAADLVLFNDACASR